MSVDPIHRIPGTFGQLLQRLRSESKLTQQQLAANAGFPNLDHISHIELAHCEPTLSEFFQIANALQTSPVFLFIDLLATLRESPRPDPLYKTRASDFAKLFRLGYCHKVGDFRELSPTYDSLAEATHTARKLNAQRKARGVALLDTILIYVRLSSVVFRPE
jgi:transcriptional regulator with XRE-family HTH domain